jgi:uncharacterized membrane protein YcfT
MYSILHSDPGWRHPIMSQQRLIWIDLAKGIGISLVVIGHAGRGLMSAAIPDEVQILPLLDGAIDCAT